MKKPKLRWTYVDGTGLTHTRTIDYEDKFFTSREQIRRLLRKGYVRAVTLTYRDGTSGSWTLADD